MALKLRLLLRADRTLCIEVSDTRPERPQAPPAGCPALDAESGRGLFLVQALALRWGVRERSVGKTVWADVSAAPDTAAAVIDADVLADPDEKPAVHECGHRRSVSDVPTDGSGDPACGRAAAEST